MGPYTQRSCPEQPTVDGIIERIVKGPRKMTFVRSASRIVTF
jgi:hypothetical protein